MAKSASLIYKFLSKEEDPQIGQASQPNLELVSQQEYREQSFGQYLRQQRILRGITRDEILRVTKVNSDYLEALESNRFDKLPPKAFIVGFLRVVAEYAGLDSDEVVNRFVAELEAQKASEQLGEKRRSFVFRHLTKILTVFGAISLLVLMFAPLFRHG